MSLSVLATGNCVYSLNFFFPVEIMASIEGLLVAGGNELNSISTVEILQYQVKLGSDSWKHSVSSFAILSAVH